MDLPSWLSAKLAAAKTNEGPRGVKQLEAPRKRGSNSVRHGRNHDIFVILAMHLTGYSLA
jgi:hypothetical protein